MNRVVSIAVAALMVAISTQAVAQEKEKVVIVAEGEKLPKVKVGDFVRITQSGPSGKTEISADVQGAAKLVSTVVVRVVKDGQPVIGAYTKEFEVKAEKRGKATITITKKDTVDKKDSQVKYELEIE